MVHSVMAVSKVNKVRNDLCQNGRTFQEEQHKQNTSFSAILQKEVENVRTQSSHCDFMTYGMDKQIHFLDYQPRKYYN